MSKAIEVITSVERRRRWSAAEKERLDGATTSRPRIPRSLMCSLPGPMCSSGLRVRLSAPGAAEDCHQARDNCSAGIPFPACLHVDACGISQVPRRPILHLCPAPRPRSNRRGLAYIGLVGAAPGPNTPKASASS